MYTISPKGTTKKQSIISNKPLKETKWNHKYSINPKKVEKEEKANGTNRRQIAKW